MVKFSLLALVLSFFCSHALAADEPPKEWIDPDTGHKIVRLSTEPGSESLYFTQNTYSPDGRKLIFTTPSGISAIDLATQKVEQVVPGPVRVIVTGRKSGDVYYTRGGTIFATNLDTHQEREVIKLPANARGVTTLNADETLFAGTIAAVDPTGATTKPTTRPVLPQRERMFPGKTQLTPEEEAAARKEDGLARNLANPRSMALFTLNAKTGEMKTFGYAYAWLNHLQFSPTDPDLLMFCHEGSWHEVDRIWTIHTDGTGLKLMHQRSMDMEIAGHEFWSKDGKTIWYDLKTPLSQVFWIAGVNIDTGDRVRYLLERDWWSVHYNISHDNKMFAGDGGDPGQVAFAKDGMWINLFKVQPDGSVSREKLVNMSKHDYPRLEPNVTFTPDDKWIVFRSNMFGSTQVFAVEIEKSK